MSNNDRQGRQLLGADATGQGDASSLLDAIFGLTQGGARQTLGEGGLGTGEASRGLVPFPQQGLSDDLTGGRAPLPSYQNPLTLSDLPNLPNFPSQQAPLPSFNPFNLNTPLDSSIGRGLSASTANTPPVFSTSLPSLASPQANPTNSKLNNLRLAIATRDPNESVEDVLSPRSLSFLHSHFQSMGVNLPAAASWGQIQQLLGQPQTPRSNLQGSSSSLFSERGGSLGGGVPQQDSAASPFQPQENFQWNPPEAGESVLDRFLASVNLPPTETNARITKLAANLILQQQQQQQEQQRLLRQHQIRQLQESFQLHTQIPPLPTFPQQPLQTPSFGNALLGAGLANASPTPPPTSSALPSLPKLNPQMTELWQATFSKENQGGIPSFLSTQKFAGGSSQQVGRPGGGQQSPSFSVAQQVAQVFVGQQLSPQRPQGFSVAQEISDQGGHQSLMSLVAPLTGDAMRRAVMTGGALSAQTPQEGSIGASLSQGSGRTGKRAFRPESPYQPEPSMEEASAESTPVEKKRARKVNSPQASSRVSFGAIPRAPTFNNRFSQVTIPPLPPTPSLQYLNQAPPLVPGIARPAKAPGGGLAAYSFPGGSLQSEEKGGKQGIGLGPGSDKALGETPVKLNRAKRGQATDPHSVAERIRRDKITEKMKQLESLVPHRHKKDKASMLEEIIEYVKFMQLQVQVLSIGTQEKAQPLREALPGGLPEAAARGEAGVLPGMGGPSAAASAPQVASQLQRSPEQAVRFLLERGLCLVPAHLAAKLVEMPPEVLGQGNEPRPTAPQRRPSTASLLASPLTRFPSETEGARPPSAVFSDWDEEEIRAAKRVENRSRDDDAREVAEAIHEQEQETRSGSAIASSGGLAVGGAFGRPQGDEEQGVDQFAKIDPGHDFDAMSPGLGEGLDLHAFEKGDPIDTEEHMATMWDSDPHE